MIKKLSIFFLLCALPVFFTACSDSASDPVLFVSPSVGGTYDVTFFATQTSFSGTDIVIADSCAKAKGYNIGTASSAVCSQVNKATGVVAVTTDATGKLFITSKMQMAGGVIEISPADKLQYTKYYAITPSANTLAGYGIGLTGYNLDAATGELTAVGVESVNSPVEYYLTGTELTIKMTLKNKEVFPGTFLDAVTTVKAKKRNDFYAEPDKKRFWNFIPEKPLQSTYDITLFVSDTGGYVVSNSCNAAIIGGYANTLNCNALVNQTSKFMGQLSVEKDAATTDNMSKIYARVQMEGGMSENIPVDKYQHLTFVPMPGAMSANGISIYPLDNATKKPSATQLLYPDSPFKVTMSDDGKMMTLEATVQGKEVSISGQPVQKRDTKIVIKAAKTTDTYTPQPNELLY